jgi:hypothetical protein
VFEQHKHFQNKALEEEAGHLEVFDGDVAARVRARD